MAAYRPRFDKDRWNAVSAYLDRVLDMPDEDARAFIAALREQNPIVGGDLAELLAERRAVDDEGFLEQRDLLPEQTSLAGEAVGAYRLIAPIGHGGMGTVWLAERSDGRFEARAAVKLLNPSLMDGGIGGHARYTRAEERFRREGRLLARLTHPNIARLLDAGVSSGAQPYLVLEYVDGQPIDAYCDAHALGVEGRIRLFLDVLSAVAHAHANLVVHRDLKPSNVLVSSDGQVKLLDFGIAKLLHSHEWGPLTREGSVALTPEYAAPEQVRGSEVTTATDVYALGVLLYLILAGQHPVGIGMRSPADLVKAILDTDPRRLSDAVAEDSPRSLDADLEASKDETPSSEELKGNAARRATTPEKLRRLLKGDLDTIVATALKKNAAERYPSVTALADDLRRYLAHEPIAARPDSLAYRTRKFLRRRVRLVAAAAGVFVVIASLTGFYTIRLAAERDRARVEARKSAKVSELLTDLLTGADPYRDRPDPTVGELLDTGAARIQKDLAGEPEILAEMLTVIGRVYQRLEKNGKARPLLEQALALGRTGTAPDPPRLAQTLNDLGVLMRNDGNASESVALLEEALDIRRRVLGNHKDTAVTISELGRSYNRLSRSERAEALAREALAMRLDLLGEEHRETATSMGDLGLLLWQRGDLAGAEPLLRESMEITRRALGEQHPNVSSAMSNLGLVVADRGDHPAAEALFRKALAIRRETLGPTHPLLAVTLNNLGYSLREQKKYAEAEAAMEEAIALSVSAKGEESPDVAHYRTNLARIYLAEGAPGAAEPLLRRSLSARLRALGQDDWRVGTTESLLGSALTSLNRLDEAEPLLLHAKQVLKDVPGAQGREARATNARLQALSEARILQPAPSRRKMAQLRDQ